MTRNSVHKATDFALELVGPLLQIIGILLFLFGAFVLLWENREGTPFSLNDAGVVFTGSAVVLLVMGTIMVRSMEVDPEDEYRLDPEPFSPVMPSREQSKYSPSPRGSTSCPTCGYENQHGEFFCAACNSPLWPAGTPTRQPLAKSVVENRIRRRIAVSKAKRLLIVGLIAVLVVSPLLVNLASEYLGLNGSILKIDSAIFYQVIGDTGNLEITWHMISSANRGDILNPTSLTYKITIYDSQQLTAACQQPDYDCVMVPGVTRAELGGTVVRFSVTGIVSQVVWRQVITRSTAFLCHLLGSGGVVSYCF